MAATTTNEIVPVFPEPVSVNRQQVTDPSLNQSFSHGFDVAQKQLLATAADFNNGMDNPLPLPATPEGWRHFVFDSNGIYQVPIDNNLELFLSGFSQAALGRGKEFFIELSSLESDEPPIQIRLLVRPIRRAAGYIPAGVPQNEAVFFDIYGRELSFALPSDGSVNRGSLLLPLLRLPDGSEHPAASFTNVKMMEISTRGFPSQLRDPGSVKLNNVVAELSDLQASSLLSDLGEIVPGSAVQAFEVLDSGDGWRLFKNIEQIQASLLTQSVIAPAQNTIVAGQQEDGGISIYLARGTRLYSRDGKSLEQIPQGMQNWYIAELPSTMNTVIPNRDFSGQDFSGRDFTFEDLVEADFSGADLRGANFDSTYLYTANFSYADLRGSRFVDAESADINLRGARLDEGVLRDLGFVEGGRPIVSLEYADLRSADLSNIDLRQQSLQGVILGRDQLESIPVDRREGISLAGVILAEEGKSAAELHSRAAGMRGAVDLRAINMTGFNVANLSFKEARLDSFTLATIDDLSAVNLQDTDLRGAQLQSLGSVIKRKNLQNVKMDKVTLNSLGDLSALNLRQLNLMGADLAGVDFSNLSLENIQLSGANLLGAKFKQTNLFLAHLDGANLKGADLSQSNLTNANLAYADAENADFTAATLESTNLIGADLRHAGFQLATLNLTNMTSALTTQDFGNRAVYFETAATENGLRTALQRLTRTADLRNVDLSGADFSTVLGGQSDFSDIDNIADLNLQGIDFRNADMLAAWLQAARLRGSNLSGVNLQLAYLQNADLRQVDLSGADLSRADLSNANLHMANLENANLTNADLTGVDLTTVNLAGADMTGAIVDPQFAAYVPPVETGLGEAPGLGATDVLPDIDIEGGDAPRSIKNTPGSSDKPDLRAVGGGLADPVVNPDGIADYDTGTQAGHDGSGNSNTITAVAGEPDDQDPLPTILEAGAVMPTVPQVLVPGGWQIPEPDSVDLDRNSEQIDNATELVPGSGQTVGGHLGKDNGKIARDLGINEQGLQEGIPLNGKAVERVPGFGEGQQGLDLSYRDTGGVKEYKLPAPLPGDFRPDLGLQDTLNPNGLAGPDFSFPGGAEEIPLEVQAEYNTLDASLRSRLTVQQYGQLTGELKTQIQKENSRIQLNSAQLAATQAELATSEAARAKIAADRQAIQARTAATLLRVEQLSQSIAEQQKQIAVLNARNDTLQQQIPAWVSREPAALHQPQSKVGVVVQPPPTSQATEVEPAPSYAPIPRYMVVATEQGKMLVENFANGKQNIISSVLPANTPITIQQEGTGYWMHVPDPGAISAKNLLNTALFYGTVKMLNGGQAVQAPGSQGVSQSAPIPQPAF